MMMKNRSPYIITIVVILLSLVACKTPHAILPKDTLKDSLPSIQ